MIIGQRHPKRFVSASFRVGTGCPPYGWSRKLDHAAQRTASPNSTRLRPLRLAWYSARSARASAAGNSSLGSIATSPILTVIS